jgi:hypothetical protein
VTDDFHSGLLQPGNWQRPAARPQSMLLIVWPTDRLTSLST